MTTISALPPAPQPTDDVSTFNAKAFALMAALAQFVSETNTVAGETNTASGTATAGASTATTKAAEANASAIAAQANALAAAASVGAALWSAGSYATGNPAVSPSTLLMYRRKAPGGASPTDPALDPANWALAIIAAPLYRTETSASANAEVNVDHALRYAGAQELVMPASPAVGDIFWYRVENERSDNYFTTGGAKVNGKVMATLVIDDPFAAGCCRYTGSSYGWSV